MHRLPFRPPFAFLALTLLTTTPPIAFAADIPAKRPRHSAAARRVSLLPLRAKIETLGHIFEEPQWISHDTLIAHANIADGFFQTPYQISLRTGTFHILDLKPEILDCKPARWSLSPDKRWALWRQGRLDPTSTIFATRIDGRGSRSWTMATDDSIDSLWLPQSYRWVSFRIRQTDSSYTYEAALIHDLDAPHKPPRVVSLPPAVKSANEVVGALPDGHIIMAKYPNPMRTDTSPSSAQAEVKLFVIDLHAPKRTQRIQFRLPKGMKWVNTVRLSPDGRSIAWELLDKSEESNAFYVSDLSGPKMRRVRLPDVKSDEGLYLQGWYSDSRSLLFEVRQDKDIPKTDYLCWVAVP